MTWKDYELIAESIRDARRNLRDAYGHDMVAFGFALLATDEVVRRLTIDLQRDNPRFNADKFQRACQ